MRFALVDNATLTAVQRLLGQIPVKNTYTIDGDILALENLVQAILFYDEVVYIEDYKEQFRASRAATFSKLMGFEVDKSSDKQLRLQAKGLTEGVIPRVEGGRFTDGDFAPFLDLLRMNLTFYVGLAGERILPKHQALGRRRWDRRSEI